MDSVAPPGLRDRGVVGRNPPQMRSGAEGLRCARVAVVLLLVLGAMVCSHVGVCCGSSTSTALRAEYEYGRRGSCGVDGGAEVRRCGAPADDSHGVSRGMEFTNGDEPRMGRKRTMGSWGCQTKVNGGRAVRLTNQRRGQERCDSSGPCRAPVPQIEAAADRMKASLETA